MLTTIRHNDAGGIVRAAQLLTGFAERNEADGQYSANFVAHIITWQKLHDLTPDGIIGPNTWTAIADNAPTCSTAKNRISAATQALQILLDGAKLTEDGIYGKNTKNAVAAFQASTGLSADGICGPKTWHALIVGAGTVEEGTFVPVPGEFRQPVDYKQADPRWGKKMYSACNNPKQTMANSACGPTAAADIVATLVNPEVTPWTLAQLSMQWGTRNKPSGGTDGKFFGKVAEYYGFEKMVTTTSLATLKACLDAGGYAVCHMGKGYWTKGGHFICAWKYDEKYIYCNDPASSKRTKQEQSQFKKERKGNYYCYYPQLKGQPVEPDKEKAIIDISKHDGDIDFATLAQNVSLVIARCSLGSDLDVRFDAYANAMNDNGIPFGVYCYSYARDKAKAQDEARKMVQYASRYNPLFYVMDAEEACITHETIIEFAEELRRLGIQKIGCYVAHHRYKEYDYSTLGNRFDFTWIPRYGGTEPSYHCDLWQYTDSGTVSGVNEDVDMNRVTGQGHDLAWFLSR